MQIPKSTEMVATAPSLDTLAAEHASIHQALDSAQSTDERMAVIRRWDGLRRNVETWMSLVHLRFHQDTKNAQHKADKDACDELAPKIEDLDVRLKRRLLDSPHRPALEEVIGAQAFALWRADVAVFDPAISDDLVKESKLKSEYVELMASATIEFRGETYNLSEIVKFAQSGDREERHAAAKARWTWFDENSEALDRIYDDLVQLRTGIARTLGYKDFVELGYLRMLRIDYDRADVERFRAQVRDHVVPLAATLRDRQAERLGVDRLAYWDESVSDPSGNPKPQGDHDWMVEQSQRMFDQLHPELGAFWELMRDRELIDLKARTGKAGGGFCTSFPDHGVPFIFANFNGTKGDVEVFTHESGHAFQCWSSRQAELLDYFWPTLEACEVHSMSLEVLTYPTMELFFGDDADRFRRIHLEESLLFLPYGVAVDHFQHLVYEKPDATPAERKAMWQEMERTYLPWRHYGDLDHVGDGGMWQAQRHIYAVPFYYIDYTLAQTCALQFWVWAEKDREEALDAYIALCKRGGRLPFQAMVRSAGLTSPFDPGCLEGVVEQARQFLLD